MREDIITTTTHSRRGEALYIKNISGNVRIVSQKTATRNTIDIEVTGTDLAHSCLTIRGAKGQVTLSGKELDIAAPHYQLQISVPSGIDITLESISGIVVISETVSVLTVINDCHCCQIFTEALFGAIFRIGSGTDINIKRLVGRLDIIATKGAIAEIREAKISTLSATISGGALVALHGSAHFARLNVERAYLHIGFIENIVSHKIGRVAHLDIGWIKPQETGSKQRALILQAKKEMAQFVEHLVSEAMPPPVLAVVNA